METRFINKSTEKPFTYIGFIFRLLALAFRDLVNMAQIWPHYPPLCSLLFILKYNLLPSSLEANLKVFGLCLVRLKLPQIYLLSIDCLFSTWLLLMRIVFMPFPSISNKLNRGHGRVNADGMLSTVWRVAYTVASCWGLSVCELALAQCLQLHVRAGYRRRGREGVGGGGLTDRY